MRPKKSLQVSALFCRRRTGVCAPNIALCTLYHSCLRVFVCVYATSQCALSTTTACICPHTSCTTGGRLQVVPAFRAESEGFDWY